MPEALQQGNALDVHTNTLFCMKRLQGMIWYWICICLDRQATQHVTHRRTTSACWQRTLKGYCLTTILLSISTSVQQLVHTPSEACYNEDALDGVLKGSLVMILLAVLGAAAVEGAVGRLVSQKPLLGR